MTLEEILKAGLERVKDPHNPVYMCSAVDWLEQEDELSSSNRALDYDEPLDIILMGHSYLSTTISGYIRDDFDMSVGVPPSDKNVKAGNLTEVQQRRLAFWKSRDNYRRVAVLFWTELIKALEEYLVETARDFALDEVLKDYRKGWTA